MVGVRSKCRLSRSYYDLGIVFYVMTKQCSRVVNIWLSIYGLLTRRRKRCSRKVANVALNTEDRCTSAVVDRAIFIGA